MFNGTAMPSNSESSPVPDEVKAIQQRKRQQAREAEEARRVNKARRSACSDAPIDWRPKERKKVDGRRKQDAASQSIYEKVRRGVRGAQAKYIADGHDAFGNVSALLPIEEQVRAERLAREAEIRQDWDTEIAPRIRAGEPVEQVADEFGFRADELILFAERRGEEAVLPSLTRVNIGDDEFTFPSRYKQEHIHATHQAAATRRGVQAMMTEDAHDFASGLAKAVAQDRVDEFMGSGGEMIPGTTMNERQLALLISGLRDGLAMEHAASRAILDVEDVNTWCAASPALRKALDLAQAEYIREQTDIMSKSTNWKAAHTNLQNHKKTVEQYSESRRVGAGSGGGPTISLSIFGRSSESSIERTGGNIIDVTPKPERIE